MEGSGIVRGGNIKQRDWRLSVSAHRVLDNGVGIEQNPGPGRSGAWEPRWPGVAGVMELGGVRASPGLLQVEILSSAPPGDFPERCLHTSCNGLEYAGDEQVTLPVGKSLF